MQSFQLASERAAVESAESPVADFAILLRRPVCLAICIRYIRQLFVAARRQRVGTFCHDISFPPGTTTSVPRFRLNTCCRRAFSVAGLVAWNSLPNFFRDPTRLEQHRLFRRLLKTYLLARYYKSTHSLTHSLTTFHLSDFLILSDVSCDFVITCTERPVVFRRVLKQLAYRQKSFTRSLSRHKMYVQISKNSYI